MDTYQLTDLQAGDIALLNSIKPDTWTSIAEIHAHYLKTTNCSSIKALLDDQIAGIGTGIVFNKTGWLAHIIVAKEHQNRGLGSMIVRNRVEYLQKTHDCKVITLTATDQGYPLYKKIGFEEESFYRIMERTECNKITGQRAKDILKIEARHYEDILKIDKMASGEERCQLLYPVLDKGFVFEKNGTVAGFYLPDFGDSCVYAVSEEAGIALLNERIKEERKIFVPEENDTAYRYLLERGYKEVKKIHRMRLGKAFEQNPQLCYSRMGGFAG